MSKPSRRTKPVPTPVHLTPEQVAAKEATFKAYERVEAEIVNIMAALRSAAARLAPAMGGIVCGKDDHSVRVMFGDNGTTRLLGMSGPGLVEAQVEIDSSTMTSSVINGTPIGLRIRFQSYATSGNTTPDECEAQGVATVNAARFTRVLQALVMQPEPQATPILTSDPDGLASEAAAVAAIGDIPK